MTNQKKAVISALVTIALVAGGYVAFTWIAKTPTSAPAPKTADSTGAPISILPEGIPEGATVTVVDRLNSDLFDKTPRPSLTRTLPRGTLPADAYAVLVKGRADLVKALTNTPAVMSNWISLGVIHKQAGDYEGARIYWTYVETVNPNNEVVHWNLGTLYENYLHDFVMAESQFRKVIALDPTSVGTYIELSSMLSSQNKNAEALTVLSDGLSKNVGAFDLLVARAHLYRSMGDTGNARAAYDAAIAQANKDKNTQLVDGLTAERNALK